VTARTFRTKTGPRVTVEFRKGLDLATVVTALEQALSAARAGAVEAGQAAA
jgi:hypothetical protein